MTPLNEFGANTMSEIKWDDQVQVQILEPTGIENTK
jgi:hypothetical protein